MLINEKPDYFLVYHILSQKQSKTLFISNYFPDHINQWSAQTRFSPCFRVKDSLLNNGEFHLSGNDFYFLFIGPLPLKREGAGMDVAGRIRPQRRDTTYAA